MHYKNYNLSYIYKILCYMVLWQSEAMRSSSRNRPWGLLSFVTEVSTRKWRKNRFWGAVCGRCVGPTILTTSVRRLPRQCGILNISQPFRPTWPVTGTALSHFFSHIFTNNISIYVICIHIQQCKELILIGYICKHLLCRRPHQRIIKMSTFATLQTAEINV
jgi:hypothetical protein